MAKTPTTVPVPDRGPGPESSPDSPSLPADHQNLLVFRVGPCGFCMPAEDIDEIIDPPVVTSLPFTSRPVTGIFRYRSGMASALCLHDKLGLGKVVDRSQGKYIVSHVDNELAALWVTSVDDMVTAGDLYYVRPNNLSALKICEQYAIRDNEILFYTRFERLYHMPVMPEAGNPFIKLIQRRMAAAASREAAETVSEPDTSFAVIGAPVAEQVLGLKNKSGSVKDRPSGAANSTEVESAKNDGHDTARHDVAEAGSPHRAMPAGQAGAAGHDEIKQAENPEPGHYPGTGKGDNRSGKAIGRVSAFGPRPVETMHHHGNKSEASPLTGIVKRARPGNPANDRIMKQPVTGFGDVSYLQGDRVQTVTSINSHASAGNDEAHAGNSSGAQQEQSYEDDVVSSQDAGYASSSDLSAYGQYPDRDAGGTGAGIHVVGYVITVVLLGLMTAGGFWFWSEPERSGLHTALPETAVRQAEYNDPVRPDIAAISNDRGTSALPGTKRSEPAVRRLVDVNTRDFTLIVERPFKPSGSGNDRSSGANPGERLVDEREGAGSDPASIEREVPVTVSNDISTPATSQAGNHGTVATEIVHIVVRGDTLWDIAKQYLGDPFRYPVLASLSGIRDPDWIYPGDRVRIIRHGEQ